MGVVWGWVLAVGRNPRTRIKGRIRVGHPNPDFECWKGLENYLKSWRLPLLMIKSSKPRYPMNSQTHVHTCQIFHTYHMWKVIDPFPGDNCLLIFARAELHSASVQLEPNHPARDGRPQFGYNLTDRGQPGRNRSTRVALPQTRAGSPQP